MAELVLIAAELYGSYRVCIAEWLNGHEIRYLILYSK